MTAFIGPFDAYAGRCTEAAPGPQSVGVRAIDPKTGALCRCCKPPFLYHHPECPVTAAYNAQQMRPVVSLRVDAEDGRTELEECGDTLEETFALMRKRTAERDAARAEATVLRERVAVREAALRRIASAHDGMTNANSTCALSRAIAAAALDDAPNGDA